MHLTSATTLLRRPGRRISHARVARPVPPSPTRLAKRGGAPQDSALYTCACGFVFTASVTTTVGCPHCGTTQAW